MFDKLRDRLRDVEESAADATVSVEDLEKSDEELEAELEAELAELEDTEEPSTEAKTPEAESSTTATPDEDPSEPATETTEPSASPQATATTEQKGKYRIDPERVEDLLWDLELVLLEADVAADVAHDLRDEMETRLPGIRVDDRNRIPDAIEAQLRDAIRGMLTGGRFDFDEWVITNAGDEPLTVMFVGVNGTGKTTTIARIAHRVKELGFGVALAAGDTYRAGAIEQLEKHGENLGLRVVKHSAGSDPAAVAYDAKEHAKARKKDLVLVDTAGRMQTDSNLMDELRKIDRVANPDLTVFVGDSLAGNDAIEQAKEFHEAVDIDCCVLTKVDTDAKGGAALSIAQSLGKPVAFLGVGEGYDDLIPFDPDWLIERIFGE